MKYLIIFLFVAFFYNSSEAQETYSFYLNKGKAQYDSGHYNNALANFEAAQISPNANAKEIEHWINQTNAKLKSNNKTETTKAITIPTDNFATKLNEADANFKSQDYSKAATAYLKYADKINDGECYRLGWMFQFGKGVDTNYNNALKWYKMAAVKGNALANYSIGIIYSEGLGVDQNYSEAISWIKKGVDAGEPFAMNLLGFMYKEGNGVIQDYSEALSWYKKSAEKGNSNAILNIGFAYQNGQGVAKDYNKALDYYQQAAEKKSTIAMNNIGVLYRYGNGVAKDYTEAMKWFQKAANFEFSFNLLYYKKSIEEGMGYAMDNIGDLYYYGLGVPKDYYEAMRWFRKAAEKNNAWAIFYIGIMYQYGRAVPQDIREAMKWFKKASDLGNTSAMNSIGNIYLEDDYTPHDYSQSLFWFQKAANEKNIFAIGNLGLLYENGYGVTQDYAKALKQYREAADSGSSWAMNKIGALYENGKGVPKESSEAIKWYKKSADNGDSVAIRKLEELAPPIATIPFELTSMNDNFFAIVGSVKGTYDLHPNFIKMNIENAFIHSRSKTEMPDMKYEGKRRIVYLTLGIEDDFSSSSWSIKQESEQIIINKEILPGETINLAQLSCTIPLTGIKDISQYQIIATIGQTDWYKGVESDVGTSYIHGGYFIHGAEKNTKTMITFKSKVAFAGSLYIDSIFVAKIDFTKTTSSKQIEITQGTHLFELRDEIFPGESNSKNTGLKYSINVFQNLVITFRTEKVWISTVAGGHKGKGIVMDY